MEKELISSDRELFDSFARSGMTVGDIEGNLRIIFTFKDSSLGDKKYGYNCIKKERYVEYDIEVLEEKYKVEMYSRMPKEYPCILVTHNVRDRDGGDDDFYFEFVYENDFLNV